MNDKKISSSLTKARVLSGVQPTGEVHLGNYLGAFKGWINNQQQKENMKKKMDQSGIVRTVIPVTQVYF